MVMDFRIANYYYINRYKHNIIYSYAAKTAIDRDIMIFCSDFLMFYFLQNNIGILRIILLLS